MNTRVDNPLCRALPSYLNRMSDAYDAKILRKYRARSTQRSHSAQTGANGPGSVWCVEPDPKRGCSVSPMYIPAPEKEDDEAWARSRSASPNVFNEMPHSTPHKGKFSSRGGSLYPSPNVRQQGTSQNSQVRPPCFSPPGRMPSSEGHAAYSNNLRQNVARSTTIQSNRTAYRSDITAQELKKSESDAKRVASALKKALANAGEEGAILEKVHTLLQEIRALKSGEGKGGLQSVKQIIQSRHRSTAPDSVLASLQQQEEALANTVNNIETMLSCTERMHQDVLAAEQRVQGTLTDVHASLRIDQECRNPIRKTTAQSLLHELDPPHQRFSDPYEVLSDTERLLLRSVTHRKDCKRKVMTEDANNKRLLEKVDKALRHAVAQEERHMQGLDARLQALQEEEARMVAQVMLLHDGLQERCKERDIVCKRLRLRQQRPLLGEDHDKVCVSLQEEEVALGEAVDHYTQKHSYLTVELARLRDTIAHVTADASEKKKLLMLDRHLLSQPSPQQGHSSAELCSGASSAYGLTGRGESATLSPIQHE